MSAKSQPKLAAQIRRLFGLAKDKAALAGMETKEYLEEMLGQITRGRTTSLSSMTFDEANVFIERLGGQPMTRKFVPRRTRNYRNQQAGIRTIATAAHLQKMEDLWFAFSHRTPNGLTQICLNTIKQERPRTADECNKIVEAVKSMNKRENASASTPSQPKFRRVA